MHARKRGKAAACHANWLWGLVVKTNQPARAVLFPRRCWMWAAASAARRASWQPSSRRPRSRVRVLRVYSPPACSHTCRCGCLQCTAC